MTSKSIEQRDNVTPIINDWAERIGAAYRALADRLRGSGINVREARRNNGIGVFDNMPLEEKLRLGLYRYMD